MLRHLPRGIRTRRPTMPLLLDLELQSRIPPRVHTALAPIGGMDEGEGTGGDAALSSSFFEWQPEEEEEEVATTVLRGYRWFRGRGDEVFVGL